jgi:hypothetical protein
MAHYRVYLLTETDRIFDCRVVDSDDDHAAVLAAAPLGLESPAVEIWAGTRKVARLTADELNDGLPQT